MKLSTLVNVIAVVSGIVTVIAFLMDRYDKRKRK